MHIVFVDIVYGYTADRPDSGQALGGTTSAVCFLAQALAASGVQVTLVNAVETAQSALGIPTRPLTDLDAVCADQSVSAFVFCGRWNAEMVALLRPRTVAPFLAWMHEGFFEPVHVPPCPGFDGILFVSDWQAQLNTPYLLPHWRQMTLHNAMNPRFAACFPPGAAVMEKKNKPPIVLYAGDFERGAIHIKHVLDALEPGLPPFSVEIYTDPKFAPENAINQACVDLLKRDYPVTHFGKVGQVELAARMAAATVFLFPNPWPETSSINLIQAMAAGLWCLTSDRAALPETASGFAKLIPIENKDDPLTYNQRIDAKAYASALAEALWAHARAPEVWEKARRLQVDYFQRSYVWEKRVAPLLDFVRGFGVRQ